LKRHERIHGPDWDLVRAVCNKAFARPDNFRRHQDLFHPVYIPTRTTTNKTVARDVEMQDEPN
jgi:hypothetical protein